MHVRNDTRTRESLRDPNQVRDQIHRSGICDFINIDGGELADLGRAEQAFIQQAQDCRIRRHLEGHIMALQARHDPLHKRLGLCLNR